MAGQTGYENLTVADLRVIAGRDRTEAARVIGLLRADGNPRWEAMADAVVEDDVEEQRTGERPAVLDRWIWTRCG
jgi:hypothetical protein